MVDCAKERSIDMIVDLSHPYAKVVSENARSICEELNIKYVRYARKKSANKKGDITLSSYEEAYEFLSKIKGTVFFTTGSKNIKDFEKVRGENRFIYRALPALESLKLCKDSNVHMRDIVGILGPFSKELNKAMFSFYQPDYCLMKDSGEAGGTEEKISACKDLGIKTIVIRRGDEDGLES